jgi:hypothetical protein
MSVFVHVIVECPLITDFFNCIETYSFEDKNSVRNENGAFQIRLVALV